MAGTFTRVDLSQLSPPNVVEALDYETILADMLADLKARDPAFTATVESDPAYKILEVAAYRETLIRQRVNDAAKAVMVAYAAGADLDQIGANYGVARLLITPADNTAIPPIAAVYESDADYRARIIISLEAYTTAGSEGSYVFHGLSADGNVRDIQAVSPSPGNVTVYVLSREGDGEADAELLATVEDALNAETVRPLTDQVTVESATIVEYTVAAELTMYPGPDPEVVRQTAEDALAAYVESVRRIGYDITLSGLYSALHQPGVQSVNLTAPVATVDVGEGEAGYCSSITVTAAGATNV